MKTTKNLSTIAIVAFANIVFATAAAAAAVNDEPNHLRGHLDSDNGNGNDDAKSTNHNNLRRGLSNPFNNDDQWVTVIVSLTHDTDDTRRGGRALSKGIANRCKSLSGNNDGSEVLHVYDALNGCAINMPRGALVSLENDSNVASFEEDTADFYQQSVPLRNLDRIDQCTLPLDENPYTQVNATGVKVYVLDSGILETHDEFAFNLDPSSSCHNDTTGTDPFNDFNGHGTHVAGIVVGKTYGVAECTGSGGNGCELCSIKVVRPNEILMADIVAGINHIINDCGNTAGQPFTNKCVAVMPLVTAGVYKYVNDAVDAATAAGVTFVGAAGNYNNNACGYTPASASTAIVAGATTDTDARLSNSNYGSCVDFYAPGVDIVSAGISSNTATDMNTGTSFAAAHVAGLAAGILGSSSPGTTPAQVLSRMEQDAGNINVEEGGTFNTVKVANTEGNCPAAPPIPDSIPISEDYYGSTEEEASNPYYKCRGRGNPPAAVITMPQGMTGNVVVSLCNDETNFDTTLQVYEYNSASEGCVTSSDDFCGGGKSQVDFDAYPENQYIFVISGSSSKDKGNYHATLTGNQVPQQISTGATQASSTAAASSSATTTVASTTAAASTITTASSTAAASSTTTVASTTTAASSTTTVASTTAAASSTTTTASTTVAASSTTTTPACLDQGYSCDQGTCCNGCHLNGKKSGTCK